MGAIIGCAKDDIKKGLAGSTMSQIGYMILAAGLGPVGYVFAIFHLLTHGIFKALLFLGAGSVMHGMDDDVNMRHYGALRKAMMLTWAVFGIGYLSIIGVPPFAGFWSKDEIIHAAWAEHPVSGVAALVGAGVTAFYMTRMMAMTFYGKARWEDGVHPHESPRWMTVPMIILAIGAVDAGFAAALRRRHRGLAGPGGRLRGGPRRPEHGGDAGDDTGGRGGRSAHRLAPVRRS